MTQFTHAFSVTFTTTAVRRQQSYPWGSEGQVDWYEGWAEFDGESRKAYLFCLRSMASGGAFHRSYPHANQQAFLEAHELAFAYFGGVFRCCVTTT